MARADLPTRGATAPLSLDVIKAVLRRLRFERELVFVVLIAVLLTSLVFSAIPRVFNRMADNGLVWAIDHASPLTRNVVARQVSSITPGPSTDVFAPVSAAGDEFRASLAPSIQRITSPSSFVVDTVRFAVADTPGQPVFPFPRFVTLRYQQDIDQHITLVDGRMPQAVDETVPTQFNDQPVDAQVFEIAISPETARQIAVTLGDTLVLQPARDDPVVRRSPYNQLRPIAVRVVGLIQLNDVTAEYWLSDTRLDRAIEYDDGNTVQIYATALFAPDAYPLLADPAQHALPFQYTWRYFVDPARLDAGQFDQLAADLRKLDAQYGSVFADPTKIGVSTGLSRILRDYLSQRNLTQAVLSLITVGLIGVAVAVLALVAGIAADRRRDALRLIRGRGASARQLLGAQVVEGFLVSVPPAGLGYLAAAVLAGGRAGIWSGIAAASVAVVMVSLLVYTQSRLVRRPLGDLEQDDLVVVRITPRRVVLEALIVALALAGVYLLRRRGIAGGSATGAISSMDPYLAAVPILLGLAVGLLTIRLYAIPARLLSWLSSLRRDLVPVLGFRRASRQPGDTSLPVLVLLLALAVSTFALVLTTTIDRGQVASSWQQVGADYRITSGLSGYLYRGVDPTAASGVEAVARASIIPDALFSGRVPGSGIAQLMLVEPARLQEVTAGTPADAHMPIDMMREQIGADIGQPTNPIPAIISTKAGNGTMAPGDTFGMSLFSRETTFVVVEVRERFAGLPIDRDFVVAPLPSVAAINPDRPVRNTDMFVRGPRSIDETLRDTLEQQSQSANLTSRAATYDAVHDAPLIAGVATGFRLGLIVTALYAGVAVAFAMLLRGKARARDQAYLRTLGLSSRQSLGLTAVEQGPGIVVGVAAGVILGLASTWLISPGLNLIEFTGPGLPVELHVSWGAVVLLLIVVIVVTAVAVLLTTRFARKISLGEVLRLGDQ